MVGNDEAGDHRFAESPARFDQTLIGARHRVFGEHDTGNRRVQERLDDDADARPREQPDPLAIGDRRIGIGRPPDFAHGVRHIGRRMDVEQA